jgi:hypothetical protein
MARLLPLGQIGRIDDEFETVGIRSSSYRKGMTSVDGTNPIGVHFHRNRPLQERNRHIDLILIPNPTKNSFETTKRSLL